MKQLIETIQGCLGDCKRLHTSMCAQKTSYELLNNTKFFVFDDTYEDQHPVKVVTDTEDYQLTVINDQIAKNYICMIKTDKCLLTDDHRKCDCILFDNQKMFFVEISEARNKGLKRRHAVTQFESIIDILRNNNVDLSRFDVKAVICFKYGKTYPTQISLNTHRAKFLANYNISLEEGNEITF